MSLSPVPLSPSSAVRLAGGVIALEALLLLLAAASYLVELVSGKATETSIAWMSLLVCIVFAGLLAVVAGGWFTGRRWPRTPTIVWNLLLLPAAWTLGTTEGALVGIGLAVLAVIGIVAALAAPSPDLPDTTL